MTDIKLFTKHLSILLVLILLFGGCAQILQDSADSTGIFLKKTVFEPNSTIDVHFRHTAEDDWIGIYPEGADPGTTEALVWSYSSGRGTATFNASDLASSGVYWIFLCGNDGYQVLDMQEITILDSDKTDYGALSATVNVSVANGIRHLEITVTPRSGENLTYRVYWSSGGDRLAGYDPLCTVSHAGNESFTVKMNDGLFMPHAADGVEIAVTEGRSTSVFTAVSEELKPQTSKLLYKFSVLTDLHISSTLPQHTSHLSQALADIIHSGDIDAVFTCGDNTNTGTAEEYDLLLQTVANAGTECPPVYYALGNHDIVYKNDAGYDAQISLFKEKLNMDAPYYSILMNGNRFIVLGSDTLSGTGTVGSAQLEWLKKELEQAGKTEPAFIFLHQPLIDTVSGSLYSVDKEIQNWYGIYESTDALRAILKDYPNTILFTGHTHWSLESFQPVLLGKGEDANFANCASVGYLWNDLDEAVGGSQGYYVEVYEDYVLLRGREFIKGNWCAAAQLLIPITA